MPKIISNPKQQKQIKELSVPVFAAVEKLMHVWNNNKDTTTYANVKKAVLELNSTIFCYKDNVPTWELYEIQKALNKLIRCIPRMSRAFVPYKEMEEYLCSIDRPETNLGFIDKLRQVFGINSK